MADAKLPRIWMMTDQRMGDQLWTALDRLPAGSGVVFRHDSLPTAARRALGFRVAERCHRHGLVLNVARDLALAQELGAAMVHNPVKDGGGLAISMSVHDEAEARAAAAAGVVLAFVSPMFATRSHPGAEPLDADRATAILALLPCPAIALGGMNTGRAEELLERGFYGWAAIDAWIRT